MKLEDLNKVERPEIVFEEIMNDVLEKIENKYKNNKSQCVIDGYDPETIKRIADDLVKLDYDVSTSDISIVVTGWDINKAI